MKLTKEELKWFEGLQNYLDNAPTSLTKKSKTKKLSSFTTGDDTVTVYDQLKCTEYEDLQYEPGDKCICVAESDSEILTIKFPFDIESTAG